MDLLCWGSGELGQTGRGGSDDVGPDAARLKEFTQAGLGRVKLLACGSSHSIVVTVDNKIFAWGNGTSGQLGDGEKAIKKRPVRVALPRRRPEETGCDAEEEEEVDVAGVSCGSRHSFLWTKNGQAFSFGNNFYAQLGYDFQRADFKEHQLAPRLFLGLPSSLKISQVTCGERHTLFALEDGGLAACGQNDYGQVGSGSNENAVIPRFVKGVARVSKVTCGANHNLALTGDGRLFQWGCGRACGNIKGNILFPEEVMLPSRPVRDIAGGCWHSLLLTDDGNVFSWGMGQEGQLGFGEDRIHISAPCLLSCSQLGEVTQVKAGDSYSAAATAGGKLLLWGRIPCLSRVNDQPAPKRLWTPQVVPLAGREVCDVACGAWHMMALTKSGKNQVGAGAETGARFRDLVSNPGHTEKENTPKASTRVHRKLLESLKRPKASPDQEKVEGNLNAEEEEQFKGRPNKDEGDGPLRNLAFVVQPAKGPDRRGNGHSSIKPKQREVTEGCRAAWAKESREEPFRRGSRDVVFTTVHLLPGSNWKHCRPTTGILPQLATGQHARGGVLAEAQKERSTHLMELVQKSRRDNSILQSPRLRPEPGPPGIRSDPAAQRVSCQSSRIELHTGLKSPINNSSLCLNPGTVLQAGERSLPLAHLRKIH
ncbi:uncharacterized protein [Antennarius striatus]|uniref:uncharacterized protein n=1 Tax=Antennarius striatus TaxID=241820 RepID=UPI0035ADA1C9